MSSCFGAFLTAAQAEAREHGSGLIGQSGMRPLLPLALDSMSSCVGTWSRYPTSSRARLGLYRLERAAASFGVWGDGSGGNQL